MPFTLGTEGQSDYYVYELALAARKLVVEVTPVQPGQQVVITAAMGVPTLDGLGAVGDGAHSVGEYVLVPSLAERAALMAALLSRW